MFTEHQISILEGFRKDHETLKTGLMAALHPRNNLHFKIILKQKILIFSCNNTTVFFTVFL